MIYFHCFHSKYWHFSRKMILFFFFRNLVLTLWAGGRCPPLALWIPMRCCVGMSEMVHKGYQKSAFFWPETFFPFFSPPCSRQIPLAGWSSNNPTAVWWPPYQWAEELISTSDPDLWKSFTGICWWKIATFLRKKSTAEMEVAFVIALIVLVLFLQKTRFCNLVHNPWKMCGVKTKSLKE